MIIMYRRKRKKYRFLIKFKPGLKVNLLVSNLYIINTSIYNICFKYILHYIFLGSKIFIHENFLM